MDSAGIVTPERFAKGRTFGQWLEFIGSPDNLAREGFDVRRFGTVRPRFDWSAYLRDRYTRARLTDDQVAAAQWLVKQPGGPAKILVIAEEWSSDCRRDLPYLARLAEAGSFELRIFARDGDATCLKGLPAPTAGGNADLVNAFANEKNGQRFATIPVAAFFDRAFNELYRYVEYPAIYRKERLFAHMRAARPKESADEAKVRAGREIGALLESPFFDVWARAAIDEMLTALHEHLTVKPA